MAFIRRIKKKSGIYLAKVENYREGGKVKQRVLKYLGKEVDGRIARRTSSENISLRSVKQSLDILCIDKIADELNLKEMRDKSILALVYSQLLENRSINKLEEWLRFTEIPEVLMMDRITSAELYNALNSMTDEEYEEIEENLSRFFISKEVNKGGAIIDVTDTYFEGNTIEARERRGKDGKVKRLVQFALAVTMDNCFPLFYRSYSGNLSNIHIFKDMNIELKNKGLEAVVIDRGMCCEENMRMILSLGMKVIAGLKKSRGVVKDIISKVDREEIYSARGMVKLKNTTVFIKSFPYFGGRVIIVYNPQLELFHKVRAFESDTYEADKWYGYSLIYHNTIFSDKEVTKKYYEKATIERAFKQLKGVLKLRPVRVWLREHIEGHFRICFLAYAILSYMDYKLRKVGISGVEGIDLLKRGYKVRLVDAVNNYEWDLYVPLEPKQQKILKALGVVYKN